MSYQTYITDAFVCGSTPRNTADRGYMLLCREAGMLFASARSVREERSKQRYALQDFSLVRVSLISGKVGWRIGSVEAIDNFYHSAVNKEARGSVVFVFRQLRRFIHGEEVTGALFDAVAEALRYVSTNIQARELVHMLIQLRLLHMLGYISNKDVPDSLLASPFATLVQEKEQIAEKKLALILQHAVHASHL